MKKESAGNYTGVHMGVAFSVYKVEEVNPATKNQWYFLAGNRSAEDWHGSKRVAILAAKEYIENQINPKS